MVSKEYPRIEEKIYRAELPNGLYIYVDQRPEFQRNYAFFVINYSGMGMKFRLDGQRWDTLTGMAYFLEHRMFDTEDGNALQDLTANGTSPDAFTSLVLTDYYLESAEESCDNLKILLSFVPIPWFTQKSVDREQGIISQEIRMVEDDPGNQVFYGLMECLSDHHPIRVPIADIQGSISHITVDTLYACHKALYTPSNMVLTMAGDVEPEEVIRITREVLPKEPGGRIERDYGGEENDTTAKPEKELRMEMSTPIFQLGFKVKPTPAREEHLHRQFMGELACEAPLGNSSPLYVRFYSEGLINKSSGYGSELYPGCALTAAGGENCNPRAVQSAVLAEGVHIAQEGVDEGLFRRLKKGVYGAKARGLSSFENVCIELAQAHFAGAEHLTFSEVFDGISKADVEDCIRRQITPERCSLAVIRPGKETWREPFPFPAWVWNST